MESRLEQVEAQYFKSLSATEGFWRLGRIIRDQVVTEECVELLRDLEEQIRSRACHTDFAYRHREEWPVYIYDRERVGVEQLVRGGRP